MTGDRERGFLDGRTIHITPDGTRWLADPRQLIDNEIVNGRDWEPISSSAVRRLVKPGMLCLDIGANIGWYTVLLSKLVGPTGRVIAFEPMAEAASVCRRNVELNGCENADVQCVAASDTDGDMIAKFGYAWPIDGGVYRLETNTARECRIDTLHASFDRPVGFVKIDVDGYESRVLRGMNSVLRTDQPSILIEVCDYTLRQADGLTYAPMGTDGYNSGSRAMLEHLCSCGYALHREDSFARIDIDTALGIADLSAQSINLVALPVL